MTRLRRDIPRFGAALVASVTFVAALWNGTPLPAVLMRACIGAVVGWLAAYAAGALLLRLASETPASATPETTKQSNERNESSRTPKTRAERAA